MTLLTLSLVLLFFTEPALAALKQCTGTSSWSAASRAATIRALGVLVLIALIIVLDPEVRAFLVFLDCVGVDIFLMLLFLQGRVVLHWASMAGLRGIRSLETYGWYPLPIPSLTLFRQYPLWSLYAAAQSTVVVLLISLPLTVVARSLRYALA